MPSTRACATKRTLLGAGPTSSITSGGVDMTPPTPPTPSGMLLQLVAAAFGRRLLALPLLPLLPLLPVSQLVNISKNNPKKIEKIYKTTNNAKTRHASRVASGKSSCCQPSRVQLKFELMTASWRLPRFIANTQRTRQQPVTHTQQHTHAHQESCQLCESFGCCCCCCLGSVSQRRLLSRLCCQLFVCCRFGLFNWFLILVLVAVAGCCCCCCGSIFCTF